LVDNLPVAVHLREKVSRVQLQIRHAATSRAGQALDNAKTEGEQ